MNYLASMAVAAVLFGAGCSKKDQAVPTPTGNTASYVFDGRAVTAKAHILLHPADSVLVGQDQLLVVIDSATVAGQSNAGRVRLFFLKPAGAPASAYQLFLLCFSPDGVAGTEQAASSAPVVLTAGADGRWSGTFAGSFAPSTVADHVLTSGVFSNVQP